jgi:hypothetical protein
MVNPRLIRLSALVGLGLLLSVASGCSRVTLGYNTADFFIERYADDYLSLNGDQMAAWEPRLENALARHRRDELPYLAAFFDAGYKGTQRGFDKATVDCLMDQLEEIYRRNARVAAGLAAPLLAGLSQRQIRKLARKFQKDEAGDARGDQESAAQRARKRAKRYAESTEWWIGPLTKGQSRIIQEVTAAMPDTAQAWKAYTQAKRRTLIRLLEQRVGEVAIRRFLTEWLVNFRDLPPDLRQAHLGMRHSIGVLFVRLDASFSHEQRAHLIKRLRDLRDDFMSLQKRPRMAATQCSGASTAASRL